MKLKLIPLLVILSGILLNGCATEAFQIEVASDLPALTTADETLRYPVDSTLPNAIGIALKK